VSENMKMTGGGKGWRIIKKILGFILPFVILIAIPVVLIWIFSAYPYKSTPDNRQDFLEQNWDRYITRGAKWMESYDVEGFELTLCPFSDDDWDENISPEEAGFICGDVTVPLFHDLPEGETITIPIAIWPDYENPPIQTPLFITHGGPGGSALDMYPRWFYPNRIGGERDLVFIDQRGTRFAAPNLMCPEVTESSSDGLEDYQDYLSYCRARLAGKGINLNAFNSPEIARDIEVVRRVLDYSQINFYGVSYGSHIGQYLAAFYPESIRSLILDGVAPIPLDYLNRSVSTHDRILNQHISNCEQDPICAEQYPDLLARLEQTVARLDKDPVSLRFHVPNSLYSFTDNVDGEIFYNYILTSSYLDHTYASLPYIIQQSEKDHYDSLVAFFEAYMMKDLTATGLYYAVICAEHSLITPVNTNENILSPSMLSWEEQDQEEYQERCSHWKLDRPDEMLTVMPKSNVPTLLLSGLFDPVTPPGYGEIALESFQLGQHLVDPVGAHGVAFNDKCTKNILEEFLDNPEVIINPECLKDPDRKKPTVPPEAISSPIIREAEDITGYTYLFSGLIFLVMLPSYIISGIRWLIRKKKGTLPERSPREKRLIRLFELASWVFILCNIGFGIGLNYFINLLSEYPGYWQANAFPAQARVILIIPPLLILVLPAVVIPSFMLWKYKKNVFRRSYYLLHVLYCGGFGFYLISSGLLLAWAR